MLVTILAINSAQSSFFLILNECVLGILGGGLSQFSRVLSNAADTVVLNVTS